MKTQDQKPETSPFDKMRNLAEKLLAIPKDEVDRREQEWKEARKDVPPAKK